MMLVAMKLPALARHCSRVATNLIEVTENGSMAGRSMFEEYVASDWLNTEHLSGTPALTKKHTSFTSEFQKNEQ